MNFTLQEMATILNAPIINETSASVTSTTFDSRQAQPGSLFVPLVAENDGHNYLQSAVDNGATVTLWQADHTDVPSNIPALIVPNTLAAFQQLAAHYLAQVAPKIVAISGSNGKTTTKDLIAAIGASTFKTVKTPANFNNEIGVPTTILSMPEDTELLVIEFGMDRPGDLTFLSKLVQPDIAVLTMIGEAHIEFFKTRDRIADGKMEIINGLKVDGTLVYNGDEPLLTTRANQQTGLHTITFGLAPNNDLYASTIAMTPVTTTFNINTDADTYQIPLTGRYNVSNALAAIAVGQKLGIAPATIANALANAPITENRTEWLPGQFGGQILSDVYNSNPTAAKEVLHFFAETPVKGERFAVLGDMLELGEAGPALHASLAEKLNPATIQHVYLVGDIMLNLVDALTDIYPADHVHHYAKDDKDRLIADLQQALSADDMVMLKGSHGIHLETVVAALQAK